MTIKHWMLLGAFLAGGFSATSLLGQDASPVPADPPPPPLIPAHDIAPKSPPPSAGKAGRKPVPSRVSAPKITAAAENHSSVDLKSGSAVAMEKNVNVRGQAAINSEIVARLKRGDVVTVLDQISLKKPGVDEPGKWAKILLPAGSVVWVHSYFVDATTKAVKPNRLNVRSGPGENYSILGRIDKGTVVRELERKGDWIKIEAPANAYAFAAAHLFSQEPAQVAAAIAKTAPAPTTPVVTEKPVDVVAVQPAPVVVVNPDPITPPVQPPTTPVAPPTAPEIVATTPPVVAPEPPASAVTPVPPPSMEPEPLLKRIVTREGMVRGSASIQAPTYFVLRSLDNNKTINYLHSLDTNIVVRAFQHQRVIVVGEEILDERWPNTPVIDVESIQTVP